LRFSQILEEATFSAEKIQLFDQLYAMQKNRLRDTIAQTGVHIWMRIAQAHFTSPF
jgi:hypothetical protein